MQRSTHFNPSSSLFPSISSPVSKLACVIGIQWILDLVIGKWQYSLFKYLDKAFPNQYEKIKKKRKIKLKASYNRKGKVLREV
mgnify:CR=1 FL=1